MPNELSHQGLSQGWYLAACGGRLGSGEISEVCRRVGGVEVQGEL